MSYILELPVFPYGKYCEGCRFAFYQFEQCLLYARPILKKEWNSKYLRCDLCLEAEKKDKENVE